MAQTLAQEALTCSICLEILKDPASLPCGHSYCLDCIQTHWDKEVSLSCPQCRQSFTPRPVLNKNTVLANLVEQLKTTGLTAPPAGYRYAAAADVSCDVCSGRKLKAVKSCLQCLASYCEIHLQPHHDAAVLQRHQLVEPSDKLQENLCSEHNELKKLFCRTEQQIICSLCVDQHRGHDTVSSAAERAQRQKELQDKRTRLIQELQDKEAEQERLRQEAQDIRGSAHTAVQRSEDSFREMLVLLEKRRSEVEQQIRTEEQEQLKQVQELQEQLQQEICDVKKKISELDTLSLTTDHNQFLLLCPSLSTLTEETQTKTESRTQTRPSWDSEEVTRAVSALRDKLQLSLTQFNIFGPSSREDFLRFACDITLDPNTAHKKLSLSEGNRKATVMYDEQNYPDHPDRFVGRCQVLSSEGLTGRCYWEVEWSARWVCIAVAYRDIQRSGTENKCVFGRNNKSWALQNLYNCNSFWFDNTESSVSGSVSRRIGVYLDHSKGELSFYSIEDETMKLLHRVQAKFTQPLFAGVGLGRYGDTAHFLKLK